jgi:hypothetical protein
MLFKPYLVNYEGGCGKRHVLVQKYYLGGLLLCKILTPMNRIPFNAP